MFKSVPGSRIERLMSLRVRPLVVVCVLFVVVAIGSMLVGSMRDDAQILADRMADIRIARDSVLKERNQLSSELQVANTDDYIMAKARQLYGYMMPGELLFVVKNPEALYGNGDEVQMYVLEENE